ncbi:MAG: DUF1854 domain-containing protein [Lachnospiraceae bacterium]|nr:DUF1854 domain-containing protein [Lachnospiraceae bacterium]MBQ8633710.1 DUF1854 domain-containing protein [Lachnospiraceae bacterium]
MDEEVMQSNLLELEEFDEEKMKAESADLLELRYLTKENAKFERTPGGFVKLTYKDTTYDRVGVYRTFPVTMPEEYISIREANEKAREIGVIEKLSALDPEQAKMLKEQLDLRYFTPEITKIFDIKTEYGYGYFHVMTTYGECRFTIHNGGSSVVSLTDTRIVINDLDGNRFEVPDIMKLTVAERKKLDLFI